MNMAKEEVQGASKTEAMPDGSHKQQRPPHLYQANTRNVAYVYNIFYRNTLNSLNYFSSAILNGFWKVAALISHETFARSMHFCAQAYVTKSSDALYQ